HLNQNSCNTATSCILAAFVWYLRFLACDTSLFSRRAKTDPKRLTPQEGGVDYNSSFLFNRHLHTRKTRGPKAIMNKPTRMSMTIGTSSDRSTRITTSTSSLKLSTIF